MPVIQVNTWICENCGAVEAEAGKVGTYWDFVRASTAPWGG